MNLRSRARPPATTAALRTGPGLRADPRGATALEFGLIGIVFLGMVLFVGQLGFYLYAQLSLDYATSYAARQMLTGNGRPANVTAATFQSATLCPLLQTLLSCSNVAVNLMPITDYGSTPPATSLLTNGLIDAAKLQFNVGQNASLMVMQVIYLAPGLGWPLFRSSAQPQPIVSTAAYVNES